MQKISILFAVSLVAVALAGCAEDAGDDPSTNVTPTNTVSPTPSPTAETTPDVTPEPTPDASPAPDGHDDGDAHHDAPSECEGGLVAADDAAATQKAGYPELTFTVQEPTEENPCFSFVGPTTATAGWTAITLENTGMAPHIMPMYFIGDKTAEDVFAALGGDEEPDWVVAAGGVGIATPFSSGTVVMDLQEGNYLLICFFEGHFMQGMWGILSVGPAEGEARPEPVADVTITMANYNFTVPENVTAGTKIVAFSNEGTEDHEAPLIRLDEGATMADFLAAIQAEAGGPPPGTGVGGVNVLAPGETVYGIVDFEPATYGLLCFVESEAHEGAAHLELGMIAEFTVTEAPAAE